MSRQAIPPNPAGPDLETTASLLALFRHGDKTACDRLLRRYLPVLTRWAHGRLPLSARGLAETDDLVQLALIRAMGHLNDFDVRHEGAFLAYLRRTLLNAIRDEIRRSRRIPSRDAEGLEIQDTGRSLVEQAIGHETLERYETALAELPVEQREAVILRLEFGLTHDQIATAIGKPSANAARMAVARALARIVEVMGEP